MGEAIGTRFKVRLPEDKEYELGPAYAERIANALSRRTKTPLMTEWVEISKDREAGVRWVTVVDRDMMAKVRPFQDSPGWTSIREPMMAGYKIDGKKYYLLLNQHGRIIGGTQNGKSSLIHSIIAHVTRCDDAVAWTCGTQKLIDLVGDWIDPYDGTDLRLPIDWIASGPQDTAEMLAAAMRIGRARQSIPPRKRPKWPSIVIILDEARFALTNTTARANLNGRSMTAAQLAQDIVTGITSAGIFLVIASQRDTNDQAGDEGGTTMAQMGYTAAFRISDKDALGRMMEDWKLPQPRFKGQYWLDPGNGDFPVQIKAPYMQESDPNKDRLHNGITISGVARARQAFGIRLDEFSIQQAGEAYARRYTRMTPEFEAYLTGAERSNDMPPVEQQNPTQGMSEVDREIYEALRDLVAIGEPVPPELQEVAQAYGLGRTPRMQAESATQNEAAVTSMVGRLTLKERIEGIVEAAEAPMRRREIIAEVERQAGREVNGNQVDTALRELVRARRLDRDEVTGYSRAQ